MPKKQPPEGAANHGLEYKGTTFFYKQSSAPRTEMGIELDGEIVRHYPVPRRCGHVLDWRVEEAYQRAVAVDRAEPFLDARSTARNDLFEGAL